MKKAELFDLLGKNVKVIFKDGDIEQGILSFADCFTQKHDWHLPGYFYLKNLSYLTHSFKVSHIKKIEIL